MTTEQSNKVTEILAGIAARNIDTTAVTAVPAQHGNVTLTIPGFPLVVVGLRGGVEAIGFRARYGYSSDVQVAVHGDLIAASNAPKAYVRPNPKGKAPQTAAQPQQQPTTEQLRAMLAEREAQEQFSADAAAVLMAAPATQQ